MLTSTKAMCSLLLAALGAFLPAACANSTGADADDAAPEDAAPGDSPGDPSDPGDPPSGGSSGDDPATCVHEGPPVIDPSTRPACDSCGGAHCLENSLLTPEQLENFAPCDSTSSCVPDEFMITGGDFLLETCASVFGAEGRCVSKCVPEIAAQTDLPQSTCPSTHACAPCYDPFDGTETGICRLSCDAGPVEPPRPLPTCCDGIGRCVPSDMVPGDLAENFDEGECPADQGSLTCVPDIFLADNYAPMQCETSLIPLLFGDAYRPGACLPECMPAVADNFILTQDGCPDSFKCAPCLDPFSGEPSGACDTP